MNYPYANGTIAAIDNNVLDKNRLSKLLKKEKNEFLKVLYDYGYGTNATDNLEDIINAEMLKTKALINEITPAPKHTDFFFLANDALNIKALYKIKIFGVDHTDILVDSGNLSPDDIKKAVFEEDYTNLSKPFSRLFKEINSKVKNVKNPRLVSAIIENSIFQYLFRSLEQTPSVALKTYFQSFVDFANVMTFIRSKNLKWNISQFDEMFIDGGLLQRTLFSQIYDSSHEEILHIVGDYYQGRIAKGLRIFYERHELTTLERYFDQMILEIMKAFRYDSFSIGPIVYYFLKKQAEAKNIRLIYANKDIDVSELLDY